MINKVKSLISKGGRLSAMPFSLPLNLLESGLHLSSRQPELGQGLQKSRV